MRRYRLRERTRQAVLCLGVLAILTFPLPAHAGVTISINNVDADKVGFNDQTPVAPVGGNIGQTLGAQRLNVFQFAADLWSSILDGGVDIVVQATFQSLPCSPTTAVLGATGPVRVFANFPASTSIIKSDTWYHAALANQIMGFDLTEGQFDAGLLAVPFNDDIVAFFNGGLDGDTGCLSGNWYYGLDNTPPKGDIALLNVVMHEFAHGLGLTSTIDEVSGQTPLNLPDRYSVFVLDTTTGKHFHEMSDAERADSHVSHDRIVWDGPATTAAAPAILDSQIELRLESPPSVVGRYAVVAASFGPAPALDAQRTSIELVNDRVGDTSDACEPLATNFRGKIAFANRGNCPFVLKVAYAEAAGASALLVANTRAGAAIIMEGADAGSQIPAVSLTQTQGDMLRSALQRADVRAALQLSADRLVGADRNGFVQLYAPDPVEPGSSFAHIDPSATPNLLMEPFLGADLDAAHDVDLTPFLLKDLGWTLVEDAEAEEAE